MFRTFAEEFVEGIRSNTDKRIFLLQVLVVSYSFTAAAFRSDTPSIANDPGALARLAIPVAAAMFMLLLRDAFTSPAVRPPHASAVAAASHSFGCTCVSGENGFVPGCKHQNPDTI
jgi:hypothetical protein